MLAHACVQNGQLPRARDLYQKLTAMEPGNPLHMKNYQQVVAQLGGTTGGKLISAEEAAVIVDELEATAPSIHQHYSDQVALSVRSALTDAELFISYNMPAKALGPLTGALPQAPSDLRLNQRLAALHTRAGRFAEAAVCCRTLQRVYSEAEYPDEATRYGELAERYEERSTAPAAPVMDDHEIQPVELIAAEPAEAAVAAPWPSAVPEMSVEAPATVEEPEITVVDEEQPAAEQEVAATEIDLSSEWDDAITVDTDVDAPAAIEAAIGGAVGDHEVPAGKVEETVEEIRFYLEHGMPEQAAASLAKLQTLTQDEEKLASLRAEVEAASHRAVAPQAEEPEPVAEFQIEEPVAEAAVEEPVAEPALEHAAPAVEAVEPEAPAELEVEPAVPEPAPAVLKEFVADLESSLGDSFLPETVSHETEPAAMEAEPVHAKAEPALQAVTQAEAASSDQPAPVLGEFVADLETSLGDDFLKGAPVAEPTPAQSGPAPVATTKVSARLASAAAASAGAPALPAQPVAAVARAVAHPPEAPKLQASPVPSAPPPAAAKSLFGEEAGVDLAEMFGELKHDLEEDVARADEDPETHYNLGIAFREMGLLDEAIGELQKTCQAVDHGHSFPQVMQTYTWLAQCFLEKGVPEASIRWYDKALSVTGIDEDTRTALHYELAAAYEAATDKPSALKHFMEVYGRNIDYRDVAERIKALKS